MPGSSVSSGVLYISYDGMLEPLGQSQVLAYQEKLTGEFRLHLLSFEKPEDWCNLELRQGISQRMARCGICWHPRAYHKRPSAPATAFDIVMGVACGLWLIFRYNLRIVHARSYVPAVIALVLKRLTGAYFVFDMRGFWADERVDGGLWPVGGRMYRTAKWFEKHFLLEADHVISLTRSAVQTMEGYDFLRGRLPPFTVIPTCADLERFKPAQSKPIDDSFVLGYVGTVGTWYLFDEVVAGVVALLLLRRDAKFLVLNRGEHEYIRQRLKLAGVPDSAVEVMAANHDEVPVHMGRMHAAIFFIKPAFSKRASAPTKLAEFLGCGIPCLSNAGVGDMAEVLEGEQVGVAIRSFDKQTLHAGVKSLLSLANDSRTRERCVKAAQRQFSLNEGVMRYASVYRSLKCKN